MKAEREKQKSSVNIPVQDADAVAAAEAENQATEANGAPEAIDPANLSAEEFAALQEQATKAQENWDRYVRLNADFDNFKKRAAKDRLDAIKYANEALIERLLPVMDNFEAALAAGANAETASVDSLITGVKMIATQLKGVLAESGLEEIDAAGKPFDPTIHEALSQQPSADVPEGHVLQQVRKGYRLKDRLVRPAAVVVAAKPGEKGAA
ncbi:nucleotide exchange factor GrpE [bacterium]|nr:nucleotide exchange factor GrpE [bacterium]